MTYELLTPLPRIKIDELEVINTIQPFGWVAGGYARHVLMEDSPEGRDMDIVSYRQDQQYMIVARLIGIGFTMDKETDNAWNMSKGGVNVDVLKRRYGAPQAVFPDFPLHNQCFGLITARFGVATMEAVALEHDGIVEIQDHYSSDTDSNLQSATVLKYVNRQWAYGKIYGRAKYDLQPYDVRWMEQTHPHNWSQFLAGDWSYAGDLKHIPSGD